jgi:hypothetical protein
MISTRSVGLVIDTFVCLTLAKWETVSGHFGGYLTACVEGILASVASFDGLNRLRRFRRWVFLALRSFARLIASPLQCAEPFNPRSRTEKNACCDSNL